jgi:lipopolysaccharide/colanic/teichoic acid biosynthesis glycosyltransferase
LFKHKEVFHMEINKNVDVSIPFRSPFKPGWLSNAFKRQMDILVSALGLIMLSPFFVIIAFLIKRSSPGPVFFRGPRMGKDERPFSILKFRTMYETLESYAGSRVTGQGDSRITLLGKWLRDTKLNELPQLWNVLAGEMSLVGPRPEDLAIAATWPEDVRKEILSVRPGITSPASIAFHDEEKQLHAESVMDDYFEKIVPDKLRLDQLYVRHHTFLIDLDVLFWTIVVLIPRLRDYKIPEGWLFGGPVSRVVRRYMSWTVIDFVVGFLSIGLMGFIWRLGGPLDIGLWKAVNIAFLLALMFGLFNTLLGLKVVAWSHASAEDVFRLVISCALVTLTIVVLQFTIAPENFLPVRFMLAAGLLVLIGFIAVRYRLRLLTGLASRWITHRNTGYGIGERVLIVGAGEGGEFATWLLKRPDFSRHYTLIGFADDHPSKQGLRFDGLKVLGTTADIPHIVKQHDIGVIFYAISKISPSDSQRILNTCKKTGLHTVMLSDMLRTLHTRLTRVLPRCERICPYLIGSNTFPASDEAALQGPHS